MVLSRKWIYALVTVVFMAALLLTMLGPGRVGPGPAFAPGEPPSPSQSKCNAGNGNGNEECDPGNSGPQNKGGDEAFDEQPAGPVCPVDEGGSLSNPGGNNTESCEA